MRREKNNKRIFIGDIVRTNKNFKPVDEKKKPINLYGLLYLGIVVSRRGDYYGIRFGNDLDFCDNLDGLLSKKVGCLVKKEDFDLVEDL